jgi:tetratricopeptide (TPR) repeat protein
MMKIKIQYFFLFFLFGLSISLHSQDNDNNFIEKTKIQHKISEGRHNFYSHNIKTALLNYKEALAMDPQNAKAEFGLAQCYFKLNKHKDALIHAKKAIKLNNEVDENLEFVLGEIYFRNGDLVQAKKHIQSFKSNTKSKSKLEEFDVDLILSQIDYAVKAIENENKYVSIKNMGEKINSAGPEFAPSISQDGKYFIFTSRRSDTKGGDVDRNYDHQYFSDIYLSKWNETANDWDEPSNYLGKINTEFHDGSLGFTADNSILVYRNIFGVTKSGDIYISSQGKSGDWATPKPIAYKDKKISNKINSTYFESSASITSDGEYIYFVSERPGGQGQADIYFVKKQGKTYTEPENIGGKINSASDEKCVFIHPDGKTLFFTSNGREESIGSYDIYYCTGGHGKWSEPINMGYPINTVLEEKTINISIDKKKAYVGAYYDIKNKGDADIYEIDISSFKF